MSYGFSVLDRWKRVEWWSGEEEDVSVLVAMELFADIFWDGKVGGVAEVVDFNGTGRVVCVANGERTTGCGLRECIAALSGVRVINVGTLSRG